MMRRWLYERWALLWMHLGEFVVYRAPDDVVDYVSALARLELDIRPKRRRPR